MTQHEPADSDAPAEHPDAAAQPAAAEEDPAADVPAVETKVADEFPGDAPAAEATVEAESSSVTTETATENEVAPDEPITEASAVGESAADEDAVTDGEEPAGEPVAADDQPETEVPDAELEPGASAKSKPEPEPEPDEQDGTDAAEDPAGESGSGDGDTHQVAGEAPDDRPAEISDEPLADGEPGDPPIEVIADESSEDDDHEHDDHELEDGEDEDEEDGEEPRQDGFDKRPDVAVWILVPVVTLILGPAIAASIMFFVAQTSTDYPGICWATKLADNCGGTILRMAAQHTVAFLICWLLLWAVPWWRGIRSYRIVFAVAAVLILVAVPLRLIHTIHLDDAY